MPGTGTKTASSYLLFKTGGYYISSDTILHTVSFDLLLDEQHSLEAEVTQHTVEDGSTISDHIRLLPRKGSLTGFVTNHPFQVGYNGGLAPNIAKKIAASQKKDWVSGFVQDIGSSYQQVGRLLGQQDTTAFTEADFLESPERKDRVSTVWGAFKQLMETKSTCTIITGLEKYMDVVITKVSTERDKDTGDAGRFKVEFQEIKFAVISEVALKNTVRPNFEEPKGKQATAKKKTGKTGGKDAGTVKLATSSDGKRYLLIGGKKVPVLAGTGAGV